MKEDGFRNLVLAFLIAMFSVTASFADWTTFAPELEEFSVEVPLAMKALDDGPELRDWDYDRRYFIRFEGTYFYVISESNKSDSRNSFIHSFAKSIDNRPTSGTVGSYDSKIYSHSPGDGFDYGVVFVVGRIRNYHFLTVSPIGANDKAKKFLGSIRIMPKDKIKRSERRVESRLDKDVPSTETVTLTPGNGTGKGSGSSSRNETRPPEPRRAITPETTKSLTLLSKPRANYTDFARYFETEGKVLLRVVFSANGKIGNVAIVEGLPFGLTGTAIEAAKGIVFEPAIRNGVPYTVTKTVQYSFSIY